MMYRNSSWYTYDPHRLDKSKDIWYKHDKPRLALEKEQAEAKNRRRQCAL